MAMSDWERTEVHECSLGWTFTDQEGCIWDWRFARCPGCGMKARPSHRHFTVATSFRCPGCGLRYDEPSWADVEAAFVGTVDNDNNDTEEG